MAANSPINYISLSDTFLTHWAQVNTALAPKALTLKAGYTHASLQADRNAFAITLTDIINADNNVQGARARRDAQQSVLKERLRQFRNDV